MTPISRIFALATIALGTGALACSCARTATEVIVRVDAEPMSLARVARVRVRVWNEGDEVRLDRVVRVAGDGADTRMPLRIPLVPLDNDASRAWRAHVEAFDEDGRKFNEVRAISTYVADHVFEVRLRLDDLCVDLLTCAEDETCRRGTCTDAHVDPAPPVVGEGLGWHELPDTRLDSVCDPSFGACTAITSAWNGAAVDAEGDRMLIWGGGGQTGNYRGNQVFAFELATQTMRALDTPSPLGEACDATFAERLGGRPAPRPTYAGLTWLSDRRRMFAYSRFAWCGADDRAWLYDPETHAWEIAAEYPFRSMYPHVAAAYDRDRGVVLFSPDQAWFIDPAAGGYAPIPRAPNDAYGVTAAIHPRRRVLVTIGGTGVRHYAQLDLATGQFSRPTLSGCEAALGVSGPGLAYDPIADRFVIWPGGDDVVILDLETSTCTTRSFPGGPGPAVAAGTYGRFGYFPSQDVFVLVNRTDQNVFALRLR